jgi:DNA polymerase III delta prime subunit
MDWREKYRPTTTSELVGCQEYKNAAMQWDLDSCPPNLLFVGPPGTGKSSAAKALARDLLGKYFDPMNFIVTNASDDRGIDAVRELKSISKQKGLGVSRRIIFLDEADEYTSQGEKALKQIMEDSHKTTIFILAANDVGRINNAIRDRCMTYVFKPLSDADACECLHRIHLEEGLPAGWTDHFGSLNRLHGGSLRRSIDTLQALPKEDGALLEYLKRDTNTLNKAALNLMGSAFPQVTALLTQALESGNSRIGVLKGLRFRAKPLMESEDDWHKFMLTYGEFVMLATQWPDDDLAFVEYFVAKLKKNMKEE